MHFDLQHWIISCDASLKHRAVVCVRQDALTCVFSKCAHPKLAWNQVDGKPLSTRWIFVLSGCFGGVQHRLYESSFLSYHVCAACRVQSCLSLGSDDPSIKTPGEFEQLVILLSVCSRRSAFLLRCTPHISTSPGISYQSSQTPERLSLSLRKAGRGRRCITAFRLKKELKRQLRPCAICTRSISAEFCWLLRPYSAFRGGETGWIIPSITKHMEVCLYLASVHICLQDQTPQSKDNNRTENNEERGTLRFKANDANLNGSLSHPKSSNHMLIWFRTQWDLLPSINRK